MNESDNDSYVAETQFPNTDSISDHYVHETLSEHFFSDLSDAAQFDSYGNNDGSHNGIKTSYR